MRKFLLLIPIMCAASINMSAQYQKSDVLASTEFTYEIRNSEGKGYTPILSLCQSDTTYYNASNYSKSSETFSVFYLGGHDQAVNTFNRLRELIVNATIGYKSEIADAKGNEFILLAPTEEKRIGTYLILQKKGEDDWCVISKNHIRNMLTIL